MALIRCIVYFGAVESIPVMVSFLQIRSISTARFLKRVGLVSPDILSEIKIAIKAVIDAD